MINSCFLGDVRDGLRSFIAAGVRAQTCVTSPPYWGLRDYGMPGQLGLEPTPAEYVANMVEVFRLVRDVLADDGTLWLNIGDSYGSGNSGQTVRDSSGGVGHAPRDTHDQPSAKANCGKRPVPGMAKQLMGIPWRLAFALQTDGWYLRSDIIWHKPNPMPESVTDRPTKAHEYLFLLAKQERYFYDADAIREPHSDAPTGWKSYQPRGLLTNGNGQTSQTDSRAGFGANPAGRNRRTVWTVATQPYSEAHFATFPTALVEPCILAGTSARGHCPACGKGWERMTVESADERVPYRTQGMGDYAAGAGRNDGKGLNKVLREDGRGGDLATKRRQTTGWQPTCECGGDPVPGVVLDPFMGSGTVAQVAQDLGRSWIGCELNAEYHALQAKRAAQFGLALG